MSDDPLEWLQFEKALAASVRIFEARGLTVRTGFQAIPGFPSDGFRADAVVTDGRRLVAVEVEVRQTLTRMSASIGCWQNTTVTSM
jgi:hypothetical protein